MQANWSTLNPEEWARVKQLFDELLGLSPNQVDMAMSESGLSQQAQAALRQLLAHAVDEQASEITRAIYRGKYEQGETGTDLLGVCLGPWLLKQCVGRGGMGEVYRAERHDGRYQAQVAVKLVRGELQAPEGLRRFAVEQQALAGLNHEHIARLYDAGQTDQGHPYFVMEYVDGETIDLACADLKLSQRLELFEQLLQAVSYAHARLLIHRDLKPSNVLVTRDLKVKLLDFGIAKALDPMQSSDVEQTIREQRVMTPAYSSPEQIRGEVVTTASDVYSLGVILYTLLTGQRPYGREATTAAEAAQAVLQEAVLPASAITSIANKGVAAELLRGDLDNILLKALHKDPEERYRSVDALAADIHAFRSGYPISARPPTAWYVLRKWIARHRWASAFSAAAILVIVAVAGLALWQAHRAEQARLLAQANSERLKSVARSVLYRVGNQIENLPGGIEIRAKMTQDLVDDLEKLAAVDAADYALQEDLAQAWVRLAEMRADNLNRSLEQNDLALKSAQRAIYWFERLEHVAYKAPSFAVSWGEAWRAVSNVARAKNDLKGALAAQEKRLAILQEADRRFPNEEHVLHGLASTYLNQGQLLRLNPGQSQQALDQIRAAERKFTELVHLKPEDSAEHHQLGVAYGAEAFQAFDLGRFEQAAQASKLAVQSLRKAAELKPQNVAHRSALANEENSACVVALLLQDTSSFDYCEAAWNSYSLLIEWEPQNAAWKLRRALGTAYNGSALVAVGKVGLAKQRWEMAIHELENSKLGVREQKRLAWIQLELAAVAEKTIAERYLRSSEKALLDSASTDSDQASWLLRARWYAIASDLARDKAEKLKLREHAKEAYQHADQLQSLAPWHKQRWSALSTTL